MLQSGREPRENVLGSVDNTVHGTEHIPAAPGPFDNGPNNAAGEFFARLCKFEDKWRILSVCDDTLMKAREGGMSVASCDSSSVMPTRAYCDTLPSWRWQ